MVKYFYIRKQNVNSVDTKTKEVLDSLVFKGHLKKSVVDTLVSTDRGDPVAVVAWVKDGDTVSFNLASHNPVDKMSKPLARSIASDRLKKHSISVAVKSDSGVDVIKSILKDVSTNTKFSSRVRKAASEMIKTNYSR